MFAEERPPRIEINANAVPDPELIKRFNLNPKINYWQLELRDNGIGLNSEHADQIFGLSRRLQGKTEFEGMGIGLAICNKIMQNHQGLTFAQSDPNTGSGFFMLIHARQSDPLPN